jgi:uncharacterized protein GlcG (DUF336 family)
MNKPLFAALAAAAVAPSFVVAQAPIPSVTQAPAPLLAQAPVSSATQAPAPVLAQAPAPSTTQAPAPVLAQAPVPSATQVPAPVLAQAPAPSTTQAPALVLAQAPLPALAAAPVPPPAPAARGPSLKLALEAAQKALDTCKGLDQKVGVTVVDSAGVLKVVLATDGASTRGVASSTNKALTALAFTASTSELGDKIKSDSALAEKIAANPNYNTHAGGLLLKVGDDVVGAIGVGGAKGSEKDEACALAGLNKVKRRLK